MKFPKVVVTGGFNSGKTTLIRTVSKIPIVTTEKKISNSKQHIKGETTVVMDFGRITVVPNTIVYLFGTPGQERFGFMWEILSKNMIGFILIIDSGNPDSIKETESIMSYFKEISDVPYILFANKQDDPDAAAVSEIRETLGLAKEEKILPCVTIDKYSASKVIREIVDMIL